MPFLKHDASQAGGFEPLPVGEYECIISAIKITESQGEKTKGAPMLKLELTVREDVEQEGAKRKLFDNLIASESTQFKFFQLFGALGFEDGREFDSIDEIAEAIAYQPVRVKTKNEDYQGKPQTKVNFYKLSEHAVDGSVLANAVVGRANPLDAPIDISDDDLPF